MKRFELNVLALTAQHVHHHLQIRLLSDITCHDVEIGAIEQDLAEKLERLPFRDVVLGQDERRKGRKELVRGQRGRRRENGDKDILYRNSCPGILPP